MMNNTKFSITIVITIISLVLVQGNFMDEFLIQFEISNKLDSDPPSITIRNSGWIQSSQVMSFVTLNNNTNIVNYDCVEGSISKSDKNTYLIQFNRMSTNLDCILDFDKKNLKIKSLIITSENHSSYIYPFFYDQQWINIMLIAMLIFSGLFTWILYPFVMALTTNVIHEFFFYRKIGKPKISRKIRKVVRDEFATSITTSEAMILKYLYDGKTTKGQLVIQTKLHPDIISYFIKLLKNKELIDENNIINSEIKKFLDNPIND